MARFTIRCTNPTCNKYIEASTGLFSKRKVVCECGQVIDIKRDKLASRKCGHCGNWVVYDQSKGEDAKCPVCHEYINSQNEVKNMEEFSCMQCGIRLLAAKSATNYECPVCGFDNNVQECLTREYISREGLASVIKYEGDNDTFIWKHPITDFNYGSQLIVHESQEAIFFRDGQALDLFGPGRHALETQQFPILEKLYSLPADSEKVFHTEVYFINKTVQMAVKWGTPDKVNFLDPLTGAPIEIGASGEMNIQVKDSRKLLVKMVGTMKGIAWADGQGFSKSIQAAFRPLITSAVKTNLSSIIKSEQMDILELDEKLDVISEKLLEKILPGFEEYGLTIPQFYVTSILLPDPDKDSNFKQIKQLHTVLLQTKMLQADATVKTVEAQSEVAIEIARREAKLQSQLTETEIAKRKAEREIIEAQAEAQKKRMEGFAEAEVMQAKGYSQKDIIQADVQKAYAQGIGNMGPVISGSGGSSVVGDMVGLGVGLAAANVISPQISNMMQGMGTMGQQNMPVYSDQVQLSWECSCGNKNATGNFCNMCGNRKPIVNDTWNCECGNVGITGNFCNNCGKKRG